MSLGNLSLGGMCCWNTRAPLVPELLPRITSTTAGCTSMPQTRQHSMIRALQTPHLPTRATQSEPRPSPPAADCKAEGTGMAGSELFGANRPSDA
jgi:hypothetical protein